MSVWTNTITNKGLGMINGSLAGETVKITRAVSGSNSVATGELANQTTIEQVKQILDLQPVKSNSDGTIEVPIVLSNLNLENRYDLGQIGLFAEDPVEGEVLLAIAQIDVKKSIPSHAESPGYSIEFNFKFKLSASKEFTVESPNSFVTMESVERLVGIHADNAENPHNVTKEQVGLGNVENVSTNDQTPTYTMASSNAKLTSGEKLSVAMGKIAKAVSSLISHLASTNNPHSVTKSQVGLGNVNNTSDANKPVSTATQAALDKKANASDLTSHTGNKSNPHSVTAAQVGLGNVDNTSDADKPISTATQEALDKKADASDITVLGNTKANASDLTSHTGNKNNPHGVTAAQVGLGNVPNVATNDQTPTYTVASNNAELKSGEKLSVSMGKIAKAISSLISHITNTRNPHEVQKAHVGLGNVDNTSDADKPISTATQEALDKKADASDVTVLENTKADLTNLTLHKGDFDNPHKVTAAQVGLGNVDNVSTNDQTPTYTAASSNANLTSGEKLSVAMGKIAKAVSSLISHLANTSNPHGVTKSQVGLGNVDNTSDANKPVSTATQTALNAKANASDLTSHTGNKSNPHGVTAEQVGARPSTWTPSATDVFGLSSNNFYNITDYASLPYGITEGVYSGLKTNDPFSESGAKRVWVMRSRGNGTSTGCIIAHCLDGGNDTGRTFVGNNVNGTMKWYEFLGKHEKPFGIYYGNSDATERTIAIKGTGNTLMIWSYYAFLLVPINNDSLKIVSGGGNIGTISKSELKWDGTTLTIKSTNSGVNANGSSYKWIVL